MRKQLNPEKSKQFRPLRVTLAILIAILWILIVTKLPTSSRKDEANRSVATENQTNSESPNTDGKYYYFTGIIDVVEDRMVEQLKDLGVPEEEFENIDDYLSKDEIFELETKAMLATKLEGAFVEVNDEGIDKLISIFNLDKNEFDEQFKALEEPPKEYEILSDFLDDYYHTINSSEDYDVVEI